MRIKKLNWTLQLVENCPYPIVNRVSIENGHDCWGNFEWTTQERVWLNNEWKNVHGNMIVLHDNKQVKSVFYDWQLNYINPDWKKYLKS